MIGLGLDKDNHLPLHLIIANKSSVVEPDFKRFYENTFYIPSFSYKILKWAIGKTFGLNIYPKYCHTSTTSMNIIAIQRIIPD